ncbi:nitrilase and fragile histidine triad fusion protein NitFhit-like protein [Conidiobolus coronatus NRRL 28638]|uniref:Nitrilase and fragile histidine triad fusion protein NitFhit-like protein n=1 Tax=Conidiobolus coronatus (strain ATCC 28846 / CBS 209.66 / NRRL 28638) TaxID=796925 RepID=A0A137NTI4_CONC2|nr:nitrilase and fragile histidine triad fusion protein NitFhit-like protein [Conidiobolus coronatus NRRL 28638]|eukprot:KXN66115.1 nitrilase and fragile histidine triad fusion protein NitFhit-like protein [Conidiobolus coronatus NRRL 28638]
MSTKNFHKLAIAQLCSTDDVPKNLQICKDLISQAKEKEASAIFFPEATDFIGKNFQQGLTLTHEHSEKFIEGLKETAKDKEIWVGVGVHQKAKVEDKLLNSYLLINSLGEIAQTYNKIHLFDIDIPNGPKLKESDKTLAGDKILEPVDTPFGKVGLAICYDIRFPQMSLKLRELGADIILYPSAFTVKTGEAHWEILNRCRAIETQTYVISPAQSGKHNEKRESYGHSMVIDPWGKKLIDLEKTLLEESKLEVFDYDPELIKNCRLNMPILNHFRKDTY